MTKNIVAALINKVTKLKADLEALVIGQFGAGFVTDAMLSDTGAKATVAEHSTQISQLTDFTAVTGSGAGSSTYACDVGSAKTKNFSLTIDTSDAKAVTLSNVPTGRCEVFLEITTSAAASVTWTLNVDSTLAWSTGSAPTLASGKVYRILLLTSDSGATWDGFASVGV
jgi:type II secretory pathway component HofQ